MYHFLSTKIVTEGMGRILKEESEGESEGEGQEPQSSGGSWKPTADRNVFETAAFRPLGGSGYGGAVWGVTGRPRPYKPDALPVVDRREEEEDQEEGEIRYVDDEGYFVHYAHLMPRTKK